MVKNKQISSLHADNFKYIHLSAPFMMLYGHMYGSRRWMSPIWPKNDGTDALPLGTNFHSHAHYELIYVLNGTFTQHLENSSYCLNAGDATLLNGQIRHAEGAETDCSCIYINMSPAFLQKLFTENPIAPDKQQHQSPVIAGFCNPAAPGDSTGAALDFRHVLYYPQLPTLSPERTPQLIINDILRALTECKSGYSFMIQGLLLSLFSLFENDSLYHTTCIHANADTENILFADLSHYIRERSGRISREELATLVHYNPDYLGRVIRRQSGMSFVHYCQQVWLEKAKELLLTTDMSVVDIIHFLDFESKNNFYRVFAADTGMTPQEYRLSHNADHSANHNTDQSADRSSGLRFASEKEV